MEKEYIHKILDAALEVNGLGARTAEDQDGQMILKETMKHGTYTRLRQVENIAD